jgi:endoglucanase
MKYIAMFCLCIGASSRSRSQEIFVNQIGYRPDDTKIAVLEKPVEGKFQIMDLTTGKSVYTGQINGVGVFDNNTGQTTLPLDFSQLRTPGEYKVWIPGTSMMSDKFVISPDVYDTLTLLTIQSFYYQRCGTQVSNGTEWHHPPCHMNDAVFFDDPSKSKDVTGGWHDAGDYGKFVPTGAVSAAFLLYLYESDPSKFSDNQLAIPESHNGVPDILDEVRWELEWLLKMQDESGGVYHKVSTKKWTGEYLPQDDPDQRYIFGISSTATGDFAAVAALSARVFEKIDSKFSMKLLQASEKAWQFLEDHPSIVPPGGFHNPPGVEGGEYGDDHDGDERLWASAELFRTTGGEKYDAYFLKHYQDFGGISYPVSWQQVQNFAYYSYLRSRPAAADDAARGFILSSLESYCDRLVTRMSTNGFRYVLTPDEFYWGSNSVALGYAFDLLQGYHFIKKGEYLEAALDQLDYMLGRNPFDQTFVTGAGEHPVRHPYHQFSMMLKTPDPVPGLVVGGANKNSRLNGRVISQWPGLCYEDKAKNYFVNEVAINYTAPLAYVAGYCSVLNSHNHFSEVFHKQ